MHNFFLVDQYSDNMQKFFDSLGEGSVDEIPEDDGDDEALDILAKKYFHQQILSFNKLILELSSFSRLRLMV